MKFHNQTKRFFDNILARMLLHFAVTLAGIGAIFLALHESSWIPIIGFAIFTTILEGFYWFDLVYGWPIKEDNQHEKSGL